MVACCYLCRVAIAVVDMNISAPATGMSSSSSAIVSSQFWVSNSKPSQFWGGGSTKLELQSKKDRLKRKLKLVVTAELSKSSSLSFGLDSQVTCSHCNSFNLNFYLFLIEVMGV